MQKENLWLRFQNGEFNDTTCRLPNSDLISVETLSNPCIYFLFKDSNLIYVGKSIQLHVRVSTHRKDKEFTHYSYIYCKKENMDDLELFFIMTYLPLENKSIPSNNYFISQSHAYRRLGMYAVDFKKLVREQHAYNLNGVLYYEINDVIKRKIEA